MGRGPSRLVSSSAISYHASDLMVFVGGEQLDEAKLMIRINDLLGAEP